MLEIISSWGNQATLYLGVRPAQSESSLVRKQFTKSKHQSVHKREDQIDRGTSYDTPERWWLVQNHGGAGRRLNRGGHLIVGRVVF